MAERQVILIIDTPPDMNDKEWLCEELNKNSDLYDIRVIHSNDKLSQLWSKKDLKSKMKAYLQIFSQLNMARKELKNANCSSIVVCWSIMTGMLSYFFIPSKIPIISLNWLSPDRRFINTTLRRKLLNKINFYSFADSPGTRMELLDFYKTKYPQNIRVFPDTFNSMGEYLDVDSEVVKIRRDERICFTGGRNNRDWNCVVETARLCPDINFVGIGCPTDVKERLLPNNIVLYDKTDELFYYNTMKKAYLIYLPLKDKRAAGAINIFRSAMNQQLCIISDAPSTGIYFPDGQKDQLLPVNNAEYNAQIVKKVFEYDDIEYIQRVQNMRQYLEENYSPNKVALILHNAILEIFHTNNLWR